MPSPLILTLTPAVAEKSTDWILHVIGSPQRTDVGGYESMLAKAHRLATWQRSTLIVFNRDRSVREAREYLDPRQIAEDGAYSRPTMREGKIMHIPISIPPDCVSVPRSCL